MTTWHRLTIYLTESEQGQGIDMQRELERFNQEHHQKGSISAYLLTGRKALIEESGVSH